MAYWPTVSKTTRSGNDCSRCSDPVFGEALRKAWGCDGPSEPDKKGGDRFIYKLGAIETDRCPLALMKEPFVVETARLFSFFEKGITPNGGGLCDETACYNDVLPLMQSLIYSAESDYNKALEESYKKQK